MARKKACCAQRLACASFAVLSSGLFSGGLLSAGENGGFITTWLILGPLGRSGGPAPGAAALRADYLTDGKSVWEETVLPVEGAQVACDFCGAAASFGLLESGTGLREPRWFAHTDPDATVCLEGDGDQTWVFDPQRRRQLDDFVAYAACYVENPSGEDLSVTAALATDDSVVLYVNEELVFLRNVARSYGGPERIQDTVTGVVLHPGRNRILLKIFEGGGRSGFRFRLQDSQGQPLQLPVRLEPGELRFPVLARRRLPEEVVRAQPVEVQLFVSRAGGEEPQEVVLTEYVPEFWTVLEEGGAGRQGSALSWHLTGAGPWEVTYRVQAPSSAQDGARFSGSWSTGERAGTVGGDSTIGAEPRRGFTSEGFITEWLLLGPYRLLGCSSAQNGCGNGALPCCAAPGRDALLGDYLTDGTVTERDIAPYPGLSVATDFSLARSAGLLAAPSSGANPGGVPQWFAWHADTGLVDLNDEAFGGDPTGCMAYGAVWVENAHGEDRRVFLGLGSDDSFALLLNGEVLATRNIAPWGRAYGGPPEVQDRIGPVALRPGENLLLVKIFEGWGQWRFALRCEDEQGRPVRSGLRISLWPRGGSDGVRVVRRLPETARGGEQVGVQLEVYLTGEGSLGIEEEVPADWEIVHSGGAAVSGRRLRWAAVSESTVLAYAVRCPGGVLPAVFRGSTWGTAAVQIGGDDRVRPLVGGSAPESWNTTPIGPAWSSVHAVDSQTIDVWTKGRDIWNRADQFTFLWQEARRPFTVLALLSEQLHSHDWAKAGIMVRRGTCANDPYAYLCVTPGEGLDWQFRRYTGAEAERAGSLPGVRAPVWLYLSSIPEQGRYTAGFSRDGVQFETVIDTVSDTLVAPVLTGLATCSHSTTVRGGASYRQVRFLSAYLSPPENLTFEGGAQITLRWRNPIEYDTLSVVRNGPDGETPLGELPGTARQFQDRSPPAGSLLYRVVGHRDGKEFSARIEVGRGAPYRVNAGGPPYIDTMGRAWISDTRFLRYLSGSHVAQSSSPVANTEEDFLFQSERWYGEPGGRLIYDFPVRNGDYVVELGFAEICENCRAPDGPDGIPGNNDDGGFGRTFDVYIEGKRVLERFRVAVRASEEAGASLPGGESHIAVVRRFHTHVTDRLLQVIFVDLGSGNPPENPKVSYLAVEPLVPSVGIPTGDVNDDGTVDIGDAVSALAYLFADGAPPSCSKAGDVNDDDRLDIADAVSVLAYLFTGGRLVGPDGAEVDPEQTPCPLYVSEAVGPLGCAEPCRP